jgi:hypothetical protein
MTVSISRLYNTYDDARAAVRNLEAAGIEQNDISIIASNADNWYSDDRKANTYPDRDLDGKDDRAEAAEAGAGVGAAIGGAAGLLAGLGIMAIPGVGPVVAAGWLASTLAGAAAGGLSGGVVGALTQAGVGKEDADIYAEGLRRGGAVVNARVPDRDAPRLQAVMDRSAVNVAKRGAAYRQAGWQSFNPKGAPYTADQIRKERDLYVRR